MLFEDRGEAGERLAALLMEKNVEADLVLAIPPGGIEVGKKVAEALNAPLDVLVSKEISAPERTVMSIGAVTSDGTLWLEDDLVEEMRVNPGYIEREMKMKREAAKEERESYRRGEPDLRNRRVLIVDQGLNTGFKLTAAAGQALKRGASKVTVGIPLAPQHTIAKLERIVDRALSVETPRFVNSVEDCYGSLETVSHREVVEHLEKATP